MPRAFDAAVFDLDGVVTFTARVHSAAWKQLFDEFLRRRAQLRHEPFDAFTDADYRAYVDGRPRADGIRTFLAARGIRLPEGSPDDPSGTETIAGLARRKDELFRARLEEEGVEIDADALVFIRRLRSNGIRTGVASSSKNTSLILESTGITDLFDACVDGWTLEKRGLRGKPAPDLFLTCLEFLDVRDPRRALLVEDAAVGVEAGRAAGFGLVLGVDRSGNAATLREHGADLVISGFREISFDQIDAQFRKRQRERFA